MRQSADDPNSYMLENTTRSHSVFLETRPSSKTSKAKSEILFNRYAGVDYLEGVETPSGTSIDIMQGSAERITAKSPSETA